MKKAVVVGSGAGGAVVATRLQGRFEVTVLEAGREFKPFAPGLGLIDRFKRAGLLFHAKEIELMFPAMDIRKTTNGMILVRGKATGGTTTLATGNALRLDQDLRELGIDLGPEFASLEREVPVTDAHRGTWREASRRLFRACEEMGLDPMPTPKMGRQDRCAGCGRCVLGCPNGVKWDARSFLRTALARGARLRTGASVERIVIRGGEAAGVEVRAGLRREFVPADVVILAAGGLGTPPILENSGIACEQRLFVDPVLCVAARWPGARQNRELPMPFFAQKEKYILSPYFDLLSYFFSPAWKPPAGDILSLMIKLADDDSGAVAAGSIRKPLTEPDREKLAEAADLCAAVFERLGVRKDSLFFGILNAGHPGGALPLGPASAKTFHDPRLPENVYVADASLLPRSLGAPPIWTIMAMAGRVAGLIGGPAASLM
jgi:choline dehydrogenase-like flavoprotein